MSHFSLRSPVYDAAAVGSCSVYPSRKVHSNTTAGRRQSRQTSLRSSIPAQHPGTRSAVVYTPGVFSPQDWYNDEPFCATGCTPVLPMSPHGGGTELNSKNPSGATASLAVE